MHYMMCMKAKEYIRENWAALVIGLGALLLVFARAGCRL